MPRKLFRTKCAACDQLVAFVSPTSGVVEELCKNAKCVRALMRQARPKGDDGDDAGADDVARSEAPALLAAEREKEAADFAAAWLAKTWAEAVIGDGNAKVEQARYPQLLAWALQTVRAGGGYSAGRSQLMDWLGLEDADAPSLVVQPVPALLACMGALGAYDQAPKLLTHKLVSDEVRQLAAATYPLSEGYLRAHLAANVQAIAKALAVKVQPQRGEAIKAILAAKLPAGTLTPELGKAFGVKAKVKRGKAGGTEVET